MSVKASRLDARPKAGPAPAVAPAAPTPIDEGELRELTEKVAYELYEKRGRADGQDFDDWLAAEKIARERLLSGKE